MKCPFHIILIILLSYEICSLRFVIFLLCSGRRLWPLHGDWQGVRFCAEAARSYWMLKFLTLCWGRPLWMVAIFIFQNRKRVSFELMLCFIELTAKLFLFSGWRSCFTAILVRVKRCSSDVTKVLFSLCFSGNISCLFHPPEEIPCGCGRVSIHLIMWSASSGLAGFNFSRHDPQAELTGLDSKIAGQQFCTHADACATLVEWEFNPAFGGECRKPECTAAFVWRRVEGFNQ